MRAAGNYTVAQMALLPSNLYRFKLFIVIYKRVPMMHFWRFFINDVDMRIVRVFAKQFLKFFIRHNLTESFTLNADILCLNSFLWVHVIYIQVHRI